MKEEIALLLPLISFGKVQLSERMRSRACATLEATPCSTGHNRRKRKTPNVL